MSKRIQCPKWTCRSTECIPLTEAKKYSVGKGLIGGAIGAAAMANPVGLLVGVASGLNGKKKVKMMCTKCGNIFEVKL